jgi:hypothetical protein
MLAENRLQRPLVITKERAHHSAQIGQRGAQLCLFDIANFCIDLERSGNSLESSHWRFGRNRGQKPSPERYNLFEVPLRRAITQEMHFAPNVAQVPTAGPHQLATFDLVLGKPRTFECKAETLSRGRN